MSLLITIRCDACSATIRDVAPGDMTKALNKAGWVSRDAKGRIRDYCPRCGDEAEAEGLSNI